MPDVSVLKAYQKLFTTDADIILIWGGRDSGKSHNLAKRLAVKATQADSFKCILLREVMDTVRDSNYAEITAALDEMEADYHATNKPSEIKLKNGNSFIGRGGDKARKLKGIKNPTDLWGEEADQLSIETIDTTLTTLRSSEVKTQAWFSLNPEVTPTGDSPIREKFFPEDPEYYYDQVREWTNEFQVMYQGKMVTASFKFLSIHTTLDVNPFCPPEKIALYESYKETNPNRYRVWRRGRWGKRETGQEFYNGFKEEITVKPCPIDQTEGIHFGVDYNFAPYTPGLCAQVAIEDGVTVIRFVKEYVMESPLNSVETLCEHFIEDFQHLFDYGFFSYADATGKAGIAIRDVGSYHQSLYDSLDEYGPEYRIANSNPKILLRRKLINRILSGKHQDYRIEIDPSCVKFIADLNNVKVGSDGKKVKSEKDKKTGGQKFGHFSDILDYMICEIDEQFGSGLGLTPLGYKE